VDADGGCVGADEEGEWRHGEDGVDDGDDEDDEVSIG
jgi:hypothetical protein